MVKVADLSHLRTMGSNLMNSVLFPDFRFPKFLISQVMGLLNCGVDSAFWVGSRSIPLADYDHYFG